MILRREQKLSDSAGTLIECKMKFPAPRRARCIALFSPIKTQYEFAYLITGKLTSTHSRRGDISLRDNTGGKCFSSSRYIIGKQFKSGNIYVEREPEREREKERIISASPEAV